MYISFQTLIGTWVGIILALVSLLFVEYKAYWQGKLIINLIAKTVKIYMYKIQVSSPFIIMLSLGSRIKPPYNFFF